MARERGDRLVKRFRVRPRRQVGHHIDLPEEAFDHVARISALAELIEFGKDARQRIFSLDDRKLRVVLALLIEAPMMLDELFFEKS